MFKGRIGVKVKTRWVYRDFIMSRIEDVYKVAEKYRQAADSMGVTIKFKEVSNEACNEEN